MVVSKLPPKYLKTKQEHTNVCSWKFSAAESEGLQIPCAAAGVLAIKSIAAQCHFVPIPFYVRKRPTKVWKQKSKAVALLFIAESEGFEPPEPRRVQQISSLPRSTTPATFRCKNTTFFACLRSKSEIFTQC